MLSNTFVTNLTADGQVKGSAGYIKHYVVTNVTVGGTLTIYNSLTETGTIISQVTLPISNTPVYIPIEANASIGIYVGFDVTLVGRVAVTYA